LLDFVEGHISEIGVRVPEIGARRWGIRHYFVNVVHSTDILVEMAGWGQAEQFIHYHSAEICVVRVVNVKQDDIVLAFMF